MRFLPVLLFLLFPSPSDAAGMTEIRAIAWPALSPDGETLAFEWLNDIWLAPSSGGEAVRVVKHDSREAYPKFMPDGERIVFSSERTGSAQIYSVKLDGSDLRQHSDHSEGNVLEAVSPDGGYAIIRGARAASGYKPERLLKVDLTRDSRELELFAATAGSVSVSPDGKRFLFCRGGEQLYRRGYRGSRASEIHLYDSETGKFGTMFNEMWEAKSPMWTPDGKGFYYLSNENGTFNIRQRTLSDMSDEQLTFFEDDSVVIPAISGDGKVMVFRAGEKVYRFKPEDGEKPEEVRFFTKEKLRDTSVRKEKVTGTSAVVFSEGGERIIFSATGDLWTMGADDDEPERLTETDGTDERELQLSSDGRILFYLSDNGLECRVFQAAWDGKKIGDAKQVPTSDRSKRSLKLSPDGRWLSWLEATGDLVTARVGGESASVIMPGWDMPTYDWSPDGNWLVVAAKDINSNRDIWLVPADGSREPFNLTMHPAFEGSPKWSPDGTKIVFTARRETDELARFWILDLGDRLKGSRMEDEELLEIADSLEMIDTDISEPMRVVWAADSKSVLFQSRDTADKTVYSLSLKGGAVEEFAAFRGIPAGRGDDGETYWRIDRVPTVFDGEKLEQFKFSISVRQERSARLRLGFRKIWRTLSERFYDETMNATNWDVVLRKYEDAAANAIESRQFDRVVAQLLGELNASHLTFKTKPWGLKSEEVRIKKPTAHPGLVFKNVWAGPLVIESVVSRSPISKVENPPLPGEIVTRIAGKDVDARTPLHMFFNGAAGRPLPVVVQDKEGKARTLELIPVSYEEIRFLDSEAKVAGAQREAADEDFVYLPFRQMKTAALRELAVEIYRSSMNAKGLVLDLRDNAGGRVADELLALFCQPVHTFTVPRGGERGYPTDRRVSPSWDGPMVVLCNGNTFSNAEIFCHAFKRLGRGKLVGTATNGGVISAVGVTIPEIGELQIPFRGWFHAETGRDLELNGAVPDVIVPLMPEDQVAGRDPQLEAAIRILQKERITSPLPEPRFKSEKDDPIGE